MSRPVPLFRRTRLHVFGPDTTTGRGYLRGQDCEGKHSKRFGESGLTFSASALEDEMASDETLLQDAFVVPEVYFETTDAFLPFGTPYMVAPGTGRVLGDLARSQSPVAVGALQGMLDTLQVFPVEVDVDSPTYRDAGGIEQAIYYNYGHKGYSESLHTWHDANVYDTTGQKKANRPKGWPKAVAAAEFVFRDAEEGGRTCCREETFTLAARQRVVIVMTSDEVAKAFLHGPNQGGCIISWDAKEDGYNQGFGRWDGRLDAGTYRPSNWFQTINSTGGDGNDSVRYAGYSIKDDGSGDVDQVLFMSGSSTRVLRQEMSEEIPGMSAGETIRRALAECVTRGGTDATYAQLLLDNRTFTDSLDTAGDAWAVFKEWVFSMRSSLATAIADMLTDCDLDMDPDFAFNGWNDRTSDHGSTPGSGLSTVELTPGDDPPTVGMNVVTYDYDSDPPGPNAYTIDTQDGQTSYDKAIDSDEFRRFGSLESGSSGSIARGKALAREAVRATGDTRRYYHAQIMAVADAVPYVDFDLCDVVHGRGYRNLGLDLEVTAMTWVQGETTLVTLEMAEPTA